MSDAPEDEKKQLDADEAELDAQLAALAAKRDVERRRRANVIKRTRLKYEQELGPEGEAFAIVDAGAEGPIVLRPIEAAMVLYKEFRSKAQKDEITLEACQKYVLPCVVFPDKPAVLGILQKRAALHDDLVVALHRLLGANEALDRGKQ